MKSTGLFLEKNQLFAGMMVAISVVGKEGPETDERGEPLLVRALVSTFGPSLRLYPFPSGIKIAPGSGRSPLTGRPLSPIMVAAGFTLDGVREDVRFMPTEVYSAAEAPPDIELVVFVDGQTLTYDDSRDCVRLKKLDGRLISTHPYQYKWWHREYPLPKNAKLVSLRGGRLALDGLLAEARNQ
ncbi:MAG: hypothetical protein HYT40_01875 [Candidatus Sungbacteria bacterium]|uniref:Uncharacterized protein n=1 Tax=Candidatus Sungiibacteriota bacterium TaxID=2750080 RepID=A0A931WP33_9BACT|nr:hypothetical protein [Candidatus Sungbacteria bacterium]